MAEFNQAQLGNRSSPLPRYLQVWSDVERRDGGLAGHLLGGVAGVGARAEATTGEDVEAEVAATGEPTPCRSAQPDPPPVQP